MPQGPMEGCGKQPKLNHRQEAHSVALFDGGDHRAA